MLQPINIEKLSKEYPQFSLIFERINLWLAKNPKLDFIDPRILSVDLSDIEAIDLCMAFHLMMKSTDYYVSKFCGVGLCGNIMGGFFDDPNLIPEDSEISNIIVVYVPK